MEQGKLTGGLAIALLAVAGIGLIAVQRSATDTDAGRDRPVAIVAGSGDPINVETPRRVTPTPAVVTTAAADRDTALVARLAPHASSDFRQLNAVVADERRDAATAQPLEATMAAEFARLPELASPASPVRVYCVATTCEISGRAAAGQSRGAVEQALQRIDLLEGMMRRGFSPGPLELDETGSAGVGFVFYLNKEV